MSKDKTSFSIIRPEASLKAAPCSSAGLLTQPLYGERVHTLPTEFPLPQEWLLVALDCDGYQGYITTDNLAPITHTSPLSTHWVHVTRTFLYPEPSIKSPPVLSLPLGARITITESYNEFSRIDSGGFIFTHHITPQNETAQDPVAVAELFLHVPYLWGGKTNLGIDCSGLTQCALQAAGYACPRDSTPQSACVGEPLDPTNLSCLQRGDLIFWTGHVGIMRDSKTLLHANAHHMLVVSEPLSQAQERIQKTASCPIIGIRRLAIKKRT
jgi:cell wall-associated NlpC family hydrolase